MIFFNFLTHKKMGGLFSNNSNKLDCSMFYNIKKRDHGKIITYLDLLFYIKDLERVNNIKEAHIIKKWDGDELYFLVFKTEISFSIKIPLSSIEYRYFEKINLTEKIKYQDIVLIVKETEENFESYIKKRISREIRDIEIFINCYNVDHISKINMSQEIFPKITSQHEELKLNILKELDNLKVLLDYKEII